ncbi:MAG: glycoside hydrolase family 28 protein [Paludibacter sp.]|jgi:polygalacturonase|nr:glycoside hydrolase family 28 protein [Paludibacter sp.]
MMKQFLSYALILMLFVSTASAQITPAMWNGSKEIEKQIKKTSFPDKLYPITDFGALEGSGNLCHEAINLAILACNQNGGGTVLIPKGEFFTGPITLKSNVRLHLDEGAVLKFATDKYLYTPAVLTRWEGVDCYNLRPLIYAYGETNIAITGKGIIDGQATNESWWSMCGSPLFGWKEGMTAQRNGGREKLLNFAETFTPIDQRQMTLEDGLRPQLINLYRCNTILIEDVTLKNSPFWVIHPLFCESLIVRGVQIFSHGPNSDGCDPESSKNVLIENCLFDTGDDCIAIKSGRNADGRKWNVPSENIIVRNCEMKDGHGGVVIGSEISGGYRNLFVENCTMDSPNLDRVIRIKTNNCRGGLIENVFVRNITVGECREAVLKINLLYESREQCDRSFPPVVRNVYLDNVTSRKSKHGVMITGYENGTNIQNIQVYNSQFDNVAAGNIISGAENVVLNKVTINGKAVK